MAADDSQRDRIARLADELAAMSHDDRRAAIDALSREDLVALATLSGQREAAHRELMEAVDQELTEMGIDLAGQPELEEARRWAERQDLLAVLRLGASTLKSYAT